MILILIMQFGIKFWEKDLLKLELPPNDIISLKQGLMPKNTNNFYQLKKTVQ